MNKVRYKAYVLDDKEVRRNIILFTTWFVLTIVSFFTAMFTTYAVLIAFFALLVMAVPMTIIICSRAKKYRKEVINELPIMVKEHKLYSGDEIFYVNHNDKTDEVTLYKVKRHIKYNMNVKISEVTVIDEDKKAFLEFCKINKIDMSEKEYVL